MLMPRLKGEGSSAQEVHFIHPSYALRATYSVREKY